jgi:hypothetical protein
MKLRDEAGLRTSFGRIPDWERDAYRTNPKGEAVHLISRHWDGAVLTLCGYVEDDEQAEQVVEEPGEYTIGWDGMHRCFHCQRMRKAMLRECREQETSG